MTKRVIMMRLVWVPTFALAFALTTTASAMDYEVELEIESIDDLYALNDSGDLEAESLEILEALFERPLNINRADRYLLYELPGVTYDLADSIVAHRAEHGAFETIEGLLAVEGMTPQLLRAIAPFATVGGGGAELPVESTADLRGKVELGSLWLQGFGRNDLGIDELVERSRGPQSYLQLRGTGFGSLGAGALLTHRRRTDVRWDRSRGSLVSDGPGNAPDLEGGYVYGGYGSWSVILGSYNVGFGERLTFDTTSKVEPHGWYENNMLRQYNSDGRIGGRSGQLGVAISMADVETGLGWLNVTAFGSWTPNDLYQYDFNHGLDEWYGTNGCNTDGDCPEGYTCGDDNMCRSSRVYDAADPNQASYRYETIRDAYDEKLAGGNVTFELSERTRFGLTGYWGQTDFNIATSAQPTFAWSARLPRRSDFGAIGANLRLGLGPVDIAAEYARTDSGGNAVFARGIYSPGSWAEITLSGRYYDAVYDNPHARPRAQRDELHGLAARNETGGRLEATIKPMKGLRLVTKFDMWANPWLPQFDEAGEVTYIAKKTLALDLNVSQRVSWSFTRDEDVSVVFDYKNKDIANNGRTEVYWLGDYCDEGETSNCGRGESRKVQLRLATSRVPRSHFWVSYSAIWEDASKYDTSFDYQQRVRLHARVNTWPGARFIASGALWFHKRDPLLGSTEPLSDRGDAAVDTFFELRQGIGDNLTVLVRYGVIHYQDERPERYAWFHLGKLALEARY